MVDFHVIMSSHQVQNSGYTQNPIRRASAVVVIDYFLKKMVDMQLFIRLFYTILNSEIFYNRFFTWLVKDHDYLPVNTEVVLFDLHPYL